MTDSYVSFLKPLTESYCALVIAAIIFGLWNVISKITITNNTSPLLFTTLRSILTIPVLYLFVKKTNKDGLRRSQLAMTAAQRKTFAALGLCQALVQVQYIYGVAFTSSQIASIMQTLAPPLTIGFGVLLRLERFTKAKIVACLLSAVGVVLLSLGGDDDDDDDGDGDGDDDVGSIKPLIGVFLLVGEAVCIALGTLLQKRVLSSYSATNVIFYQTLVCTVLLTCFSIGDIASNLEPFPPWPDDADELRKWSIGCAFSIIFCTCFGYSCKAFANSTLNAGTVVLSQPLQPLVTVVVAFFALGETVVGIQFLGSVFILFGCVFAGHAQKSDSSRCDSSSGEEVIKLEVEDVSEEDGESEDEGDGARLIE